MVVAGMLFRDTYKAVAEQLEKQNIKISKRNKANA